MLFRFGRYELDEEAGELRREGTPVPIQPKPLGLLCHLVRGRDRVVPLEELFEALWPGVAVTPSSLTRAVSVARSAIGDTRRGATIRSYARRGYRFCAEVVALEAGTQRATGGGARASGGAGDFFVGRDDALAQLRTAWTQTASGSGALALVTGAPGIGKTRLVEVFAAEAEGKGALVLVGRARDGEGMPAFWLWTQVLRNLAAQARGDESHAIATASTALADLVPDLDAAPQERGNRVPLAPEQSRFRLFDGVARALVETSRRRPLVLVLEDLQWAGSGSLRLLEHLVFEGVREALLLVATVRDEPRERGHPLERILPILRQQPHCFEIALRGFSRGEVARLLESRLARPAPPDLTSELFARTEGVPLLLREALRLLADRGDLERPDGVRRWAVSLPSHALDLIRRPLERLSAPCAELLAAASVIGREFPITVAAAVAGISRDEALDRVDEAQAAGVVETAPEAAATWRFSHALFQEAVYAGLPAGRRARLHARAADEIERRFASDLDRVIAELAHHHHEALAVGNPERAFACAERAAARARRVFAWEQAATHYAQAVDALDHTEPVDAARRLAALLDLGDVLRLAGERARRREVFADAMAAARVLGRPLELARAAIGFCDLSEWAPRDAEARAALEEALAGLPPEPSVESARLLTRLAYLAARTAGADGEPAARQAVAQARAVGDRGALQEALYALHLLIGAPHRLEERDRLVREMVDAAAHSATRDPTVIALVDAAADRLSLGDAEGARAARRQAGELAGQDPHLGLAWHLRVHDAGIALLEGRFDEAGSLAEQALGIGARIDHPYARGVHLVQWVEIVRERDDHEALLGAIDLTNTTPWMRAIAARSLATRGRTAEARAVFEALAARDFGELRPNVRLLRNLVEIALLCADLRDGERAARLLALLAPFEPLHAVLPIAVCYAGPVTRALARLHEVLGDLQAASELYDRALADAAELGARPIQARALVEHGALLVRRGERRHGRELAGEGVTLATSLGMRAVAAAGQALLESARRR